MDVKRRRIVASALGMSLAGSSAFGQARRVYPDRPVTIYVPAPPGGVLDGATRQIAEHLRGVWGQAVIVETKLGAAGSVAAAALAKLPPDGQVLLTAGTGIINNLLSPNRMGYRLEDLAPVCMNILIPTGFGVRASLGVKTLGEFIAMARANPGKLTIGVPGVGSGSHVAAELLCQVAGINCLMVQYKGEAPAMLDVMSGTIDAMSGSLGGVVQQPGKILPLGLTNPSRHPNYPDVPTFGEAGYEEANLPGWAGIFAPANTPKEVIDKIAGEIGRAVALPAIASKLLAGGSMPSGVGPEKLAEIIQNHLRVVRRLVDSGKISFA